MAYILFHIPHSSLKIPNIYFSICTKNKDFINKFNIELSDYLTDKLIPNNCHKLIFKYSRLFCDVEKFKDDSKEIMSQKGMGVIYTKIYNNIITIPNKKYKTKVIKSYYDKHHNKLNKIIIQSLKNNNKCILIDFHSFSDEMVNKLFNIINTPDICIGIDKKYTNQKLLNFTINYFKKYDYSVKINTPYSGTMIPNKFINKNNKNFSSIMIEINKRIYLNNKKDFIKLKNCIENYYKIIKKF